MTVATVRLGGTGAAHVAGLSEALVRSGCRVVDEGDRAPLDLAVFVDGERHAARLLDEPPARWLDGFVAGVSDAFTFVRSVVPRLGETSGGLVLVTSLAGEIGVPGRSLDAAAAGALGGLARSVVHDAPSIWVMLMMEWTPAPVGEVRGADVAWERVAAPPPDASVFDAVARRIRLASDPPPRGGTLITCTRGAIAG